MAILDELQVYPSREEFFRRVQQGHALVQVFTTVVVDSATPLGLYRRLAEGNSGAFLLESAASGVWDRYSFIGCRALTTLTEYKGQSHWIGTPPAGVPTGGDPLEALGAVLHRCRDTVPPTGLPPMVSSLVGYLGWDMVRRCERLGEKPAEETPVPEFSLYIPAELAVFDSYTSSLTVIANVLVPPDSEPVDEHVLYNDALKRIDDVLQALSVPKAEDIATWEAKSPTYSARTSYEDYVATVQDVKDDIHNGEAFQVVVGQRFDHTGRAPHPVDLYRVLRTLNPSNYMYILDVPTPGGTPMAVVGSSPESLVTVNRNQVSTMPIAGSRPRGATPQEDKALAQELLADEKERAEHLMLVDLARNDIAKVCEAGSIDVVEFMNIKKFSHIMHMAAVVTGTLRENMSAVDVLRAVFPAGTLSGAPKPRALEIIDRVEPVSRGVYGGVVGYLGFNGDLDVAIAIRTGVIVGDTLSVYAGAGIVADSVPESEWQESSNKAHAVLRAAASAQTLRTFCSREGTRQGQQLAETPGKGSGHGQYATIAVKPGGGQ